MRGSFFLAVLRQDEPPRLEVETPKYYGQLLALVILRPAWSDMLVFFVERSTFPFLFEKTLTKSISLTN